LIGDAYPEPARAIRGRGELLGQPAIAVTAAPVAAPISAIAQRGQQLGGLGSGDFLLFEQFEDPQAILVAVAGLVAGDVVRHDLDAPHRPQQLVGIVRRE